MNRRASLRALLALGAAVALPALPAGAALDEVRRLGRLRVTLYKDFPPYVYGDGERGIDVDIARALAGAMNLEAEIAAFPAGENMGDDLRIAVWRGHYLGFRPGDVMLHVPVDDRFAKTQDKVRIFAPYHVETIAMARHPQRVPRTSGSAAVALEVFTREKIGVEGETLADSFLLGVLNGRLRENVVHFRSVDEAMHALHAGQLAAVLGTRAEIEGGLQTATQGQAAASGIVIEAAQFPELTPKSWALGMAVRVEDEALAAALSAALAKVQEQGRLAEIFRHYGITHQPL